MNKLALGLGVALLTAAAPVYAADLPSRKAAPAYPALTAFSWTGLYAGLHVGYGFGGEQNVSTVGQLGPNIANIATGARPGSVDLDRNGFIGGAQIGYNWQIGSIVYGLETDISYTDLKDIRAIVTPQINTGLAQSNLLNTELKYLGTARARLGYAFDRTLVYATGGLAYGEVENSFDMLAPTGIRQFAGTKSDTKFGYTVGAGIEYAITNTISFKAEYLYYDLGKTKINVAAIPGTGVAGGYTATFRGDGHIVRTGVNYKF